MGGIFNKLFGGDQQPPPAQAAQTPPPDPPQEQPEEPPPEPPPAEEEEEEEEVGDQEQEGEEEPQPLPQQEEEGEGAREEEGNENEDESKDVLTELKTARYDKFSEREVEGRVGPHVALDQSYQSESKARSEAIEQEYNTLFGIRSEIHALLMGFKQRLDVPEEATLSVCFRKIRELIGKYDNLELNEEEMKIEIDQDADANAVEAVNKFNLMLERCHDFKQKLPESTATMEAKLKAFEREAMHTKASWDAVTRAKKLLGFVTEWDRHIRGIIHDTRRFSGDLAWRNYTGMIRIVLED